MRNKNAILGQLAFIFIAVALLVLVYSVDIREKTTGFAVLEDADVFAGKDTYKVGDMAHLFILPKQADYSVEVYGPDNNLYAVSLDFPVEKPGKYTVKATLSLDNKTKKITAHFNVKEIKISEIPAASVSTPINISDTSDSAAGVQTAPEVNAPVKDNQNRTIGKKIEDEEGFETFFTFAGRVGDDFIIKFHHNSTITQPVWIEGYLDYELSSLSAEPNETITLTIPLKDKTSVPKFKLHVGLESEVFEFDIGIILNVEEGEGDDLELNKSDGIVPEDVMKKDIEFSKADMVEGFAYDENNNLQRITKIEKEGIRIDIRGAGKDMINNAWFRKGVLHVDSVSIKNATIKIPYRPIRGIMKTPNLLIKEDSKTEWKKAKPYKKNGNWYNKVRVDSQYYIFDVEHFTEYQVNESIDDAWATGMVGNGVKFQGGGTDQYIKNSDYNIFHTFNKTVCAWIKPDDAVTAQSILGSGTGNWRFLLLDNDLSFSYQNSSNRQKLKTLNNNDITGGAWQHVCFTINVNGTGANDCVNRTFFFNGTATSNDVICQGHGTNWASQFDWGIAGAVFDFNGTMDEARFWNISLNESEINCIWSNESNGQYCTQVRAPALEVHLNETKGYTAEDTSGNSHDGMLTNFGDLFGSIESCFDAVNNSADSCTALSMHNYDETFSAPKKYNATSTSQMLKIQDCRNISIDYNNSDIIISTTFISFYDSLNITNQNMNVTSGYHVFGGGSGYLGNFTFINLTGHSTSDLMHFGSGTENSTINITHSTMNCTGSDIRHYASNLYMEDNIIHDCIVWMQFPRKDTIKSSIFDGGSYIKLSAVIGNMTIQDNNFTGRGIETQHSFDTLCDSNITNNIFSNITIYDAISLANASGTRIVNNTFNECGNITYGAEDIYRISNSPRSYGGNDYNYTGGSPGIYVNTGAAVTKTITEDDTNITDYLDGTGNGTLCLYDLYGTGSYITAIDTNTDNCSLLTATIQAGYPGSTLDYAEPNVMVANGLGSDYTMDFSGSTSLAASFTSPYLRYENMTLYHQFPIRIASSDSALLSGNTFNSTGDKIPYNITSYNASVWLNNFYDAVGLENGTSSHCINSEGNFYEESISSSNLPSDDCGPVNFTYPLNGTHHSPKLASTTINTTWEKQSSYSTINYTLLYSNNSGSTWYFLTANTTLFYLLDITGFAENDTYVMKVIPYDGLYNATNVYSYFGIDNTDPIVSLISPADLTNLSNPNITFSFNVTDNLASVMNCSLYVNSTLNQTNTSISNGTQSGFSIINLADNNYYWDVKCWDLAGNSNFSENRSFILDATAPTISSINITPNSTDDFDPLTQVNVSCAATDSHPIESVELQYKRGVAAYTNVSMTYNSSTNRYNASFTTQAIAGTYTIRITANDSFTNRNVSEEYNIDSDYEFHWNHTPADFGTTQGVITTSKTIGNLTINNTGDDVMQFDLSDNSPYGVTYNTSEPFYLNAKEHKYIRVNATFGTSDREDSFNITITASHSPDPADPTSVKIPASIITFTGGPFLSAEIDSYPQSAFQSKTYILVSHVKNLGNETSTNTWLNWTLPAGWLVSSGDLNYNISNLTAGSTEYNNVSVSLNASAAESGNVVIYINSSADSNIKDSDYKSVSVYCNVTDGICGANCTTRTDPDCEVPAFVTEGGTGAGGGGGGVSAPISTGKVVEGPTEKIEILKGTVKEFPIVITNTYEGSTLEDVVIDIEGYLSQYINITPNRFDRIGFNKTKEFKVRVEAPSYMGYSNYTMNVTIDADIVSKTETNETLKTKFIDRRIISLIIQEVSGEEASSGLAESQQLIREMEEAGFSNKKISKLYQKAEGYYKAERYHLVIDLTEQIAEMRDTAFKTYSLIEDINQGIEDAEYRGLQVIETKRLLSLALVAFEREDYATAQQRAKDAQLTLIVETRGKFNIINFIIRNYIEIIIALIALTIITLVTYARISSILILRKLKYLDKSEITIKELIKQTQKECFETRKMTVLEYHKAMYGYNKRLDRIRHQRLALRSRKVGLIRVSSELENLKRENDYLLKLIMDVQRDYFEIKRSDWETYTSKMDSLSSRRAEIEKSLAMLEAKALLEKRKKGAKIGFEELEQELEKESAGKKEKVRKGEAKEMKKGEEVKEKAKEVKKETAKPSRIEEKPEERSWLERFKERRQKKPEAKEKGKEAKKAAEMPAGKPAEGRIPKPELPKPEPARAEMPRKPAPRKRTKEQMFEDEVDSRIKRIGEDEVRIREKLDRIKKDLESM